MWFSAFFQASSKGCKTDDNGDDDGKWKNIAPYSSLDMYLMDTGSWRIEDFCFFSAKQQVQEVTFTTLKFPLFD